jgi:hypothetical protein
MFAPPASASPPIGFKRHVTAVIGANFVAATVLAVYVGGLTAFESRSASLVLMISTVTWLGVFAIAAPASGLFFTIAFPLLRRARARGLLISVLLGALGGYATMWSNYAAVAKQASASELGTATLLGAILGGVYWLIAGRAARTATSPEVADVIETEAETEVATLQQV